jgi:hypothetical protein
MAPARARPRAPESAGGRRRRSEAACRSAAAPDPSRPRRAGGGVPPDPAPGGSGPSPASRDLRRPRARRRHPTWRAGVESAHASGVSARVVLAVCMCNQATGGPRRCGRTRTQVSTYVYIPYVCCRGALTWVGYIYALAAWRRAGPPRGPRPARVLQRSTHVGGILAWRRGHGTRIRTLRARCVVGGARRWVRVLARQLHRP